MNTSDFDNDGFNIEPAPTKGFFAAEAVLTYRSPNENLVVGFVSGPGVDTRLSITQHLEGGLECVVLTQAQLAAVRAFEASMLELAARVSAARD